MSPDERTAYLRRINGGYEFNLLGAESPLANFLTSQITAPDQQRKAS
jgi:hypothetical protein